MNFLHSLDVSASGMTAERFRMDTISNNIANANTTKTVSGMPYQREVAVITPADQPEFILPVGLDGEDPTMLGGGVKVDGVAKDTSDFKYVYEPDNPEAIKEGKWKGYVAMPNINIITEMTNMIAASRAFEANATAIEAAKSMASKALEIGR
ncbi:MAG: flagellar basal body rod protein FlgC [Chloroflexi bacterium]|nr:flagellar basal body rod protein FlgC [Chloroflexota bacterium]